MAKTQKNVMIVIGSPRKRGNSSILAKQVASGAEDAGAKVELFFLHGMNIKPCSACEGCRKKRATGCVIRDDMQKLYPKMRAADAIVIASPIYWFTVSAQTKLFMDRGMPSAPTRITRFWRRRNSASSCPMPMQTLSARAR